MGLARFFSGLFAKKHKRIGLALGSGGAKGFAHIGALKAFSEEGIEFDIVAGTSIGSIVGGMYACGYGWKEMLGLFREYDIIDPKKFLTYAFKKNTVTSLLDEILGGKHFEDTDIPFAAVAADIDDGRQVVIRSGDIASAMAASGAVPPVFRPVTRDGKRLVDGACLNAVPADVVKSMGADVVISINLSSENTNERMKGFLDTLYKGHKIVLCDRLKAGRDHSDVFLSPDLSAFRSTSFSSGNEIFEIGYECVKIEMPEIKRAIGVGK